MYSKLFLTFLYSAFILCSMAQNCPLKCPSCTKCDPRKGTCTLARDFVSCTKTGAAGVCFAGTCNTKISVPSFTINKCQTYSCPQTGVCTLVVRPDGDDCTPLGVAYESVCMSGVCQRVWLGVGEEMPFQNTGCVGKPNGVLCDTNHVLNDGERCVDNICKQTDGNFYGYLPVVPIIPPPVLV
jgi:hypothetical protein